MRGVRKSWAENVGQLSKTVVVMEVEVADPQSDDPPCRVRGHICVPSRAQGDAERYYLANILVAQTRLPLLRPQAQLRIVDMTMKRHGTRQRGVEVDEAGGLAMPQSMWWEQEYVEKPYMRAFPMRDLNLRLLDIMTNMVETTEEGKLGVRDMTMGVDWMRYGTHVLTEARERGMPYPLFIDKKYTRELGKDDVFSSVKNRHAARAGDGLLKRLPEGKDVHVVKYGESCFMENFLQQGEILVSPSRRFDDKRFNKALRDDENTITMFGARTSDGNVIPASDLPTWWGDRYSMLEFPASMDRDYMIYCMALSLSPTLFSHFGENYDACVVIHDMSEFVQRLEVGTRQHFRPTEFIHGRGNMVYVDPLGAIEPIPDIPPGEKITIPFLKHFRHAYQDEFRFVWVPQQPRRGFEAVCLRIGSIEDIATMIHI